MPDTAHLKGTTRIVYQVLCDRPRSGLTGKQIAAIGKRQGILQTRGKTPEETINRDVREYLKQCERTGEWPLIVRVKAKKSIWKLNPAPPESDPTKVLQAAQGAANEGLRRLLLSTSPVGAEDLVRQLLEAEGFLNVTRTRFSGDKGVDVHGDRDIGLNILLRTVVQVKRQIANVQSKVIRDLRGSLAVGEIGIVVSACSGFSEGAKREAIAESKQPIHLIDTTDLVGLMVKHQIGCERTAQEVVRVKPLSMAGPGAGPKK